MIKIPLPKANVIIVRSNPKKIPYVYYYTKVFRNEKKKPDNKRISIGKLCEEDNTLIPNNNYYDVFKVDKNAFENKNNDIKVSDNIKVGSYILFESISKKLNLLDIVKTSFEDYKEILTIIFYMLSINKAMIHIDDFCSDTKHFLNKVVNSRTASQIFKSINNQNKWEFFKEWIKQNKKEEYIAYDITSISSYCQNNDYVEWGYNRDGEDLEQINLGTFFGESSKLPIYYNTYSGSIVDKSYLEFMMQGAKELELDISKYVMDKGFYTQNNIDYMDNEGLKFIVCAKENKAIKELVISKIKDVNSAKNYIIEHEIYGTSYDYQKYKIHIFFDIKKLSDQEKNFYHNISKYEKELGLMKNGNESSLKKYKKYFNIKINKNGSFTFEKDYDKINELHSLLGYFACISNDLTLSSSEVIEVYRNKDIVEKHFDNLKNYTDGYRSRTHSTDTYEGKTFLMFICLIYKSYIENICKNYIIKNKITTDKIISELAKIKIIKINGETRLVQPLTKTQKDIYSLFDMTEDDINEKIVTF